MGIQGLLPLLRSIHEHCKISEFSRQTLAVDAYVWLHRGAYGCATELVKGIPTTRYVDYAMHRVRLLKHYNITPYLVFDGGPLPAKRDTESKRFRSRQENREKGMALAHQGRHSEARECFVKAVDVTPEMAYQLIKALQAENVAYVVAPYEADAQMAYLERAGFVHGIITEDSDLLVFGCKRVIFKLDSNGGCVCIRRENFARVTEVPLHNWTDKQFREMAMLSGCDYLPSIQGLGLKTAHKLLRKHKTIEGVLNAIRMKSILTVPVNYLKDFRTAELAFMHQRVYDPNTKRLTCLLPFEDEVNWDNAYVGVDLDPDIARGVAEGSVHPFTFLAMPDINPSFRPHQRAVVSFTRSKATTSPLKTANTRGPTNVLTNYFTSGATARRVRSDSVLSNPAATAAKENVSTLVGHSGSGKRTLTFERDQVKQAQLERAQSKLAPTGVTSKFFSGARANNFISASQPTPDHLKLSHTVIDVDAEDDDIVTQETGYISPTASFAEMIDVSSPPTSREGSLCLDDSHIDVENSSADSDDAEDIPSSPYDRRAAFEYQTPSLLNHDNLSPSLSFPTPNTPSTAARGSGLNESQRHHHSRYALLRDERNTSSLMSSHRLAAFTIPSPQPSQDHDDVNVPSHSAQNEETPMSAMPNISLEPGKAHIEPESVSSAFTSQTNMSTASMSTIFVVETPPRPHPRRSRSPSWGPDLRDMFSPARSEIESVMLGSEVSSPVAGRKAKPEPWNSPDYKDVEEFCTPGSRRVRPRTVMDDEEELDIEDEEGVPAHNGEASMESIEAKWREKWVNTTPLLSKRKQEAISPQTAPHPKRPSEPRLESNIESTPLPTHMSWTTAARASTGPRQSWPLSGSSVQSRMLKPLPRRIGAGIALPEPGKHSEPRNRDVVPLDLDVFRHKK